MDGSPHVSKGSWFRFRYEECVDTPNDTRNALLVVATVITAVTFQSGVNPPGGVWQDDTNGHKAGTAIYASRNVAFHVFLTSNTLAISSSILVLMSLTYKFPFYLELLAAILGMLVTYASAVFAISPDESVRFGSVLGAVAVPFMFRKVKGKKKMYCSREVLASLEQLEGDRLHLFAPWFLQDKENRNSHCAAKTPYLRFKFIEYCFERDSLSLHRKG
ncbi:unnamed protein product [Fraxinus pennsylvanica]|uniref:PGG domain-containing protein n=1 Tax=Fraxinus pennsylvanica TaxID=56036 RepID=A0AAD2E8U6_9LAMI|nr:unnamed protein product [Fraxinus pennsylvanica]